MKSKPVLITITNNDVHAKLKEILPNYKMSFSDFCNEMSAHFVDAVENNNGNLNLILEEPKDAIQKKKTEVEQQ